MTSCLLSVFSKFTYGEVSIVPWDIRKIFDKVYATIPILGFQIELMDASQTFVYGEEPTKLRSDKRLAIIKLM